MNHPIRFCLSLLLAGGMTAMLPAQENPPPPPEVSERSDEDLDELLGPIALYPDDLVALILPAAAQPTDIVLAARYLDSEGAMEELDKQPWDESVRAVAHFPDVVEWMSNNLAWTQDVGDAFLAQPAAVMKSIQRLRAKAHAAGTLRNTEQQKVLLDGSVIRIVSAEPDVIYVPRYRTEVVYVDRPVHYSEPWITFGIGWRVGRWHRWECDWYSHRVWVFDHHDQWRARRWNTHVHFTWRPYSYGRAWCPPPSYVRHHHRDHYRHRGGHRAIHRPSPYVENESRRRDRIEHRNTDRINRARNDGLAGDRRNQERNNNRSERSDRRVRTLPGDRTAPNTIVNTSPAPAPDASRGGGNNRGNARRDTDSGIDRRSNAGHSDRRVNSPGSRNVAPVNPAPRAAVASNPPPVVTASPAVPAARSRANETDRRDYTQRSRQQPASAPATDRTVRVYAPERASAATDTTASRAERSEPAAASSRQVTRGNSEGRSAGRGNEDAGRSRDAGRSDSGDRGGRSNNSGHGRGR